MELGLNYWLHWVNGVICSVTGNWRQCILPVWTGLVSTIVQDTPHKIFVGCIPNYLNEDQVITCLLLHWFHTTYSLVDRVSDWLIFHHCLYIFCIRLSYWYNIILYCILHLCQGICFWRAVAFLIVVLGIWLVQKQRRGMAKGEMERGREHLIPPGWHSLLCDWLAIIL